jgi:hypothetical protein
MENKKGFICIVELGFVWGALLVIVLPEGTWLNVTIIGKMSSTSKRLSSPLSYNRYSRPGGGVDNATFEVGPAPDDMGTWGSSAPAHVGMSTLGSLIEIGGFLSYLYSETPLTFQNLDKKMVTLVVEATEEEKKVFNQQLQQLRTEMAKFKGR